jgi:VanZ family protein
MISEKECLGILCGIIIVGVLICTLWPFNPFPSNQVSWLAGSNGIRFGREGVIVSMVPMKAGAIDNTESRSLELFLQPAESKRKYTILSFYRPDNPEQFQVNQWTDGLLVVRNALDPRKKMKKEKFDLDHALQAGKSILLTMTSGRNGTTVYVNGLEASRFPRFTISEGDLSGWLVLGTSANYYQPWPGEIRGLAIYSKELTPEEALRHFDDWMGHSVEPFDLVGAIAYYSLTENKGREIHNAVQSEPDLEIPTSFRVPYKTLLASPVKEFSANLTYLNDLVENIAGFVPVGFLVCAYLGLAQSRKHAILCTILVGGGLSFVIEVLQFYIPRRVSGTTDIITNTLGTALGAVLARPNLVRVFLRKIDSVVCSGNSALRPE